MLDCPENCPAEQIAANMYDKVIEMLYYQDVYFVFDRYKAYSIKSSTRAERAKNRAYRHQITSNTILPSKEKVLSCTSNKVQFIDIVVEYLVTKILEGNFKHRFVITGSKDTPTQVLSGKAILRHDLTTSHEEADGILIQQCYHLAKEEGCDIIRIVSDDADVFALACHFFPKEIDNLVVYMEPASKGRSVIDIGESVKKHPGIMPYILQMHALTGCDSVGSYHGIGKATAINVLEKGKRLDCLGVISRGKEEVLREATDFIGLCYGLASGEDMSAKR